MNHADLTKNHILENWVFSNATNRMSATGLLGSDIGKISYQVDTHQYWRLTSTAPTWVPINPPSGNLKATPPNPATTVSTTGVMMGLAQSFTPIETGNILVVVTGSVSNSAASGGSTISLAYGTGTPPGNGVALPGAGAGNAVGAAVKAQNNASMAASVIPFNQTYIVTGLVLGTPYWIDLLVAAVTSGTVALSAINISVLEL